MLKTEQHLCNCSRGAWRCLDKRMRLVWRLVKTNVEMWLYLYYYWPILSSVTYPMNVQFHCNNNITSDYTHCSSQTNLLHYQRRKSNVDHFSRNMYKKDYHQFQAKHFPFKLIFQMFSRNIYKKYIIKKFLVNNL